MYVCMYVCMHACVYVRTYVRMYVCMYVCVCVCVLYLLVSKDHCKAIELLSFYILYTWGIVISNSKVKSL